MAALLDNGASQQVQTALNPTAVTPMLLAVSFGHDECVRVLASHNPAGQPGVPFGPVNAFARVAHSRSTAAVHACDANGVSPLMMAAAHASVPAVVALLQAGARQAAVDLFGRRYINETEISSVLNTACSALHRAAAAGGGRNRFDAARLKEGGQQQEGAEVDEAKPTGAVIALLTRDDGALVEAVDHAGYTALHVAAAAADADAVGALCAAGARYDFQAVNDDDEGSQGFLTRFPLHFLRCSLPDAFAPEPAPMRMAVAATALLEPAAAGRGAAGLQLRKLT